MSVEKTALRAVIRTRLRELNADKALAAERSSRAAAVLTESDAYKGAGAVLAFLSFGTEIKTHDLVKQMLADGKRVAIPRTFENEAAPAYKTCDDNKAASASKACAASDDARMEFYWLSADAPLEEQVEKGDFGILVPRETLPIVDPAALPEKTLMVLPGVAFSKAGWRLGQGRGFYDRYLEQSAGRKQTDSKKPVLAGFCYELQIVPEVPHDLWDIPVDYVITENGVIPCKTER